MYAATTYQQQKINHFLLLKEEGPDINYNWYLDNNEITLLEYLGSKRIVIVPSEIETHPVKYIASSCFTDLDTITSVIIPDGVTAIY